MQAVEALRGVLWEALLGELRWPSPEDLDALAELAALGVHDPKVQPFMVAWTDTSPDERARSTMQYHWSRWGSWWRLP